MKHKFLGIKKLSELNNLKEPIQVSIHFKYPNYQDLLAFKPKKRIQIIQERQLETFRQFTADLSPKAYVQVGSTIAPSGIKLTCSKNDLLLYNQHKDIEHISILGQENNVEMGLKASELFFTIVVRFAVQIENKTKGLQTFEDRMLLVKGANLETAKLRLQQSFKDYEKPYLNSSGELVRWKFEAFIDAYEVNYASLEDMLSHLNKGIEVFSSLRNRRLNKGRVWIRKIGVY